MVLALLASVVAAAALAVTSRFEAEGRAEAGVAFTLAVYALIVGPVFALGYTGTLSRGTLVLATLIAAAAVAGPCIVGRSWRARVGSLLAEAVGAARLPVDAFGLAFRERSVVLLGLAAAAASIAGSFVLTYLASSESWDGFYYHEPIVGFALQNRGFRFVQLPLSYLLQPVNGYPRACEAFALWFVALSDRTWIELGNTIGAPGLVLAVFTLARRYGGDRTIAMGWSTVVLLVPAVWSQLRSSMIDVQVAFFGLAALHFATRPCLRLRDAAAAWVAMAFMVASKTSGCVLIVPIASVACARVLLVHGRSRPVASAASVVLGVLGTCGVGALTFVRNWLAFGNPIWPVSYSNAALGIRWPGLAEPEQVSPDLPLIEFLRVKYHHPTGGIGDIIARDYGYGVPWVVAPLAVIALALLLSRVISGRLARSPDARDENLVLVTSVAAVLVLVTPSLHTARYNVPVIAAGVLLVHWLGSRQGWSRLGEGAVAAALVLSVVSWVWTEYLLGVDLSARDIGQLLRATPIERASMNFATFQMPAEVARRREAELAAGARLAFTDESHFIGVLFNHEFSNVVQYVPFESPTVFEQRLAAIDPRWVVVGRDGAAEEALRRSPEKWEYVGEACRQDGTVAYRQR